MHKVGVVVSALGLILGAAGLGGCSSILGLDDPRLGAGDHDGGPDAATDGAPGPDALDAATGPDANPDDVVGTWRITNVLLDGTTLVTNLDIRGYGFQAEVYEGGHFRTIDGEGTEHGTFVIHDVPQGTYYLKVNVPGEIWPSYYVTDRRSLQLGDTQVGRPAASPSAPSMV